MESRPVVLHEGVGEHFIPFKAAAGTPYPIRPRLAGAGLDALNTGRLLSISIPIGTCSFRYIAHHETVLLAFVYELCKTVAPYYSIPSLFSRCSLPERKCGASTSLCFGSVLESSLGTDELVSSWSLLQG